MRLLTNSYVNNITDNEQIYFRLEAMQTFLKGKYLWMNSWRYNSNAENHDYIKETHIQQQINRVSLNKLVLLYKYEVEFVSYEI